MCSRSSDAIIHGEFDLAFLRAKLGSPRSYMLREREGIINSSHTTMDISYQAQDKQICIGLCVYVRGKKCENTGKIDRRRQRNNTAVGLANGDSLYCPFDITLHVHG